MPQPLSPSRWREAVSMIQNDLKLPERRAREIAGQSRWLCPPFFVHCFRGVLPKPGEDARVSRQRTRGRRVSAFPSPPFLSKDQYIAFLRRSLGKACSVPKSHVRAPLIQSVSSNHSISFEAPILSSVGGWKSREQQARHPFLPVWAARRRLRIPLHPLRGALISAIPWQADPHGRMCRRDGGAGPGGRSVRAACRGNRANARPPRSWGRPGAPGPRSR